MDNWLVLSLRQDDILALEEAIQVLPVVQLLIQLETVVKLVHLKLLRVVAREDLGVDPSVGQVALGIGDLVRQIKRLDPLSHLTGQ